MFSSQSPPEPEMSIDTERYMIGYCLSAGERIPGRTAANQSCVKSLVVYP